MRDDTDDGDASALTSASSVQSNLSALLQRKIHEASFRGVEKARTQRGSLLAAGGKGALLEWSTSHRSLDGEDGGHKRRHGKTRRKKSKKEKKARKELKRDKIKKLTGKRANRVASKGIETVPESGDGPEGFPEDSQDAMAVRLDTSRERVAQVREAKAMRLEEETQTTEGKRDKIKKLLERDVNKESKEANEARLDASRMRVANLYLYMYMCVYMAETMSPPVIAGPKPPSQRTERVADRLRLTFIPVEDPDGSERRVVANQPVVIYRPSKGKVLGLTFVVTAANMPLSKYATIIAALNSVDHVVVGFFVNVLRPLRGNHRAKAERIAQIFLELKREFTVMCYNIVGHSIGGKIALLAAALYDEKDYIRNIVALDPVDQHPVEFTKDNLSKKYLSGSTNEDAPPPNSFKAAEASEKGRQTVLSLESSSADITLTLTDTGYFIDKKHNAREIHKNNPSAKLVMHRNSCHMVYCDDGGLLSWKAFMGRGKSADHNQAIRGETITLIKEKAMRWAATDWLPFRKMKSTVGTAKHLLTSDNPNVEEL